MKSNVKRALLIGFFLKTYFLCAQADFSGTWILNQSKSDAEFRDYEITCVISQTEHIFTVEQTIFLKNGEKSVMPAVAYNLDGVELIKDEKGIKNRITAYWSQDKDILTIKYVRTVEGKEYGSIVVYKLSYNGQFLSIKSSGLTGDTPMTQVYNKK